jgi:hypothetical protein
MDEADDISPKGRPLRRGWTTGACATAATRAALGALLGGAFEDPVTITLPGGQHPAFALAVERSGEGFAEAGIIKDAGDDPDVTHGALVLARVAAASMWTGSEKSCNLLALAPRRWRLPANRGRPAHCWRWRRPRACRWRKGLRPRRGRRRRQWSARRSGST